MRALCRPVRSGPSVPGRAGVRGAARGRTDIAHALRAFRAAPGHRWCGRAAPPCTDQAAFVRIGRKVGPCPRHTDPAAAWRSAQTSCVCSDAPSPMSCRRPSRPAAPRPGRGHPGLSAAGRVRGRGGPRGRPAARLPARRPRPLPRRPARLGRRLSGAAPGRPGRRLRPRARRTSPPCAPCAAIPSAPPCCERCQALAEQSVRARLAGVRTRPAPRPAQAGCSPLPGGRAGGRAQAAARDAGSRTKPQPAAPEARRSGRCPSRPRSSRPAASPAAPRRRPPSCAGRTSYSGTPWTTSPRSCPPW